MIGTAAQFLVSVTYIFIILYLNLTLSREAMKTKKTKKKVVVQNRKEQGLLLTKFHFVVVSQFQSENGY